MSDQKDNDNGAVAETAGLLAPRSLKLSDLPPEILTEIVQHFNPYDRTYPGSRETEMLAMIRNLRLVNRLFCDLSTPLLLRTVHIDISQASLDNLGPIFANPKIAAAIRAVKINMNYRPKIMAEDIQVFGKSRLKVLKDESHSCGWYLEPYTCFGARPDVDTPIELWGRGYYRVYDFKESWQPLIGDDEEDYGFDDEETERSDDSESEGQDEDSAHEEQAGVDFIQETNNTQQSLPHEDMGEAAEAKQEEKSTISQVDQQADQLLDDNAQLLLRGHEEFRRLHEEQYRLVANGLFVEAVTSALKNMPHVESLAFYNKRMEDYYSLYSKEQRPKDTFIPVLLLSNDALSAWLPSALSWTTAEDDCPGKGHHFPARLLTELPIAIHKAKAAPSLASLTIDSFPCSKDHDMITPPSDSLGGSNARASCFDELRAACQSIEKIEFNGPSGGACITPADDAKEYIDNFIVSVVSSPRLRDLKLDFQFLKGQNSPYEFGPAAVKLPPMPLLNNFTLRHVKMDQPPTEALFRGHREQALPDRA
ncbi:hypothetical protein QBC41DRAFT_348353 [Cercophora samala]|uniref:F-box domain-containing protein n=1 Tax=Cercophora samala TaxID=330535 RepID=A0AA39Z9Y2_9PEZI|nr:hypothetical protein QBC41DRAFT_348353 [Cercophora samala]